MSVSYFIPDLAPEDLHRCEEIVRRSRFIVSLAHTPTPEAAKSFIERIKQEFPDATHNCWAYAAGAPGQTSKVGYSDDGEPHGHSQRLKVISIRQRSCSVSVVSLSLLSVLTVRLLTVAFSLRRLTISLLSSLSSARQTS